MRVSEAMVNSPVLNNSRGLHPQEFVDNLRSNMETVALTAAVIPVDALMVRPHGTLRAPGPDADRFLFHRDHLYLKKILCGEITQLIIEHLFYRGVMILGVTIRGMLSESAQIKAYH